MGCEETNGIPFRTVESNDDVETDHVLVAISSAVSHFGRYLNNMVDEEKSVKPVSLGEEVAPAKNWKLELSVS